MKRNLIAIVVVFGIVLFSGTYSRSQGESQNEVTLNAVAANSTTQADLNELVGAYDTASANARFACPRYFLIWGDGLYNLTEKDNAQQLVQSTKKLIGIAQKEVLHEETEVDVNFPTLKANMIAYLAVMGSLAEAYEKYFNTADAKDSEAVDKLTAEIEGYSNDVAKIIKSPLADGEAALDYASDLCPRWLISWSELLQKEEEKTCKDCADVVEVSKNINDILFKAVENDEDPNLKSLFAEYHTVFTKMTDAFINYYNTGDDAVAELPYQYQDEVLAVMKKIQEYQGKAK